MEQLGNVLAAIVVFGSLWLVRKLTKAESLKSDFIKRQFDENSISLDEYEKDLDKIFDYSKVKTISIHEDSIGEENTVDYSIKSKFDENISGGEDTGEGTT